MSPVHLNDKELIQKLKSIAANERRITQFAIEYIAEVDSRKLYLKLGFSSMYEYLRNEIGYSEGCAQRRIDAARLLQKNPEVSAKIAQGSLNLAQISKTQQIFRQVKKETLIPVPLVLQKEILNKIEYKSVRETALILAQEFNICIETSEKRKIQRDESVRIELTFAKEEMTILRMAQELLSNRTGGQLKATLLEMAKRTIKNFEQKPSTPAKGSTLTIALESAISQKPSSLSVNKSITPRVRREIFARDRCCQYKNQATGKICGSKLFLEIDHIQPKFAGGDNQMSNLRLLCRNHNQYRFWAGK